MQVFQGISSIRKGGIKETIKSRNKKAEKEYVWDYTEKYPVLLEEKESDGTIVRYTYAGNRERAYADVTKNLKILTDMIKYKSS